MDLAETDHVLLRRIAGRDENALRHLYRRHGRIVYALAYRMLGDAEQAEEVMQETFIRVWRMAHTFDPTRGHAEAWIITIARNLATSEQRKRSHTLPVAPMELIEELPDDANNPEEIAWLRARQTLVHEALAALPDAQRQVILFTYFDGLTQNEIAQSTGEPLGTIKSRLRLGLRRLSVLLQDRLGDLTLSFMLVAFLSMLH